MDANLKYRPYRGIVWVHVIMYLKQYALRWRTEDGVMLVTINIHHQC